MPSTGKYPGDAQLIEWVEDGWTFQEIADHVGVGIGTVSRWVNAERLAEESARARALSAEALLDKGMGVLRAALSKESGMEPSIARQIAQEYARRAAIRNPQYRDSAKVEATVSGGLTISRVERVIVDAAKNPADQDG